MLPSLTQVVTLLEHYNYIIIFPIAVLEGPIITIISGFLVSLGFLNGFVAYVILVLGDLTGDVLYYAIGRFGGRATWVKKIGKYVGYTEESEHAVEDHFKKHKGKTFILGKLAHGVGGTALFAAGIAKVNFWEFIGWNTLGTLPKTLVLILIGYYVGSSYTKIDKYLSTIALVSTILVVALVVGYIVLDRYANNFFGEKDVEKK